MESQFLWIHPFHELTPLINYETQCIYPVHVLIHNDSESTKLHPIKPIKN